MFGRGRSQHREETGIRTARAAALVGALLASLSSPAALAKPQAIGGIITDQNGEPLARVRVSLIPGNVELVTDRDGRFEIGYLRDDTGARVKIEKRRGYEIEMFKPGFHTMKLDVAYKNGILEVDPVSLLPEVLEVPDIVIPLDVSGQVTQNVGNTKEWD